MVEASKATLRPPPHLAMIGSHAQDLVLDPAIRNWVLGPLTLVLLLSGLIRHYVTQLLNTPPKAQTPLTVRESYVALSHLCLPANVLSRRALTRGLVLRTNGSHLPPSSFLALKSHLSEAYTSGLYLKAPPPEDGSPPPAAPNPLTDPGAMDGMMDMVKKQAVQFLPQVRPSSA